MHIDLVFMIIMLIWFHMSSRKTKSKVRIPLVEMMNETMDKYPETEPKWTPHTFEQKPSPLRTSTRPSQQNHYDHTNLPPSDLRMNQDTSKVNARNDESKTQTRTIRLPEADTTHKLLRPALDRCDLNILEHPTSCYAYFLVERICNLFIVYGFLVVSVWEREGK